MALAHSVMKSASNCFLTKRWRNKAREQRAYKRETKVNKSKYKLQQEK